MKYGQKKRSSLTVVIPVYNESILLEQSFSSIRSFIHRERDVSVDVIFVDDGSPDNSYELLKDLVKRSDIANHCEILHYDKNRGKGYAVRKGILAAGGSYILMSDFDLSTPLEQWRKLKHALDMGADFAIGSRAVLGAQIGHKAPFHRRILSKVFNLLVHWAGVKGIRDTQCGFKLFRRGPAHRVFEALRTARFAFDVEMIAVARLYGFKVAEIAVRWDYSGHSTVRIFSSGFRMIWDLMRLVLRRWIGGNRIYLKK